jgi:hypothetical protein
VATRNALVKQLKAEGDRDAATAIAAMRRPPWTDWALNVVASEDAPVVDRFVDAAAAMREAQQAAFAGRSGVDLRSAINELRERTGELARRANEVLTGNRRPAALAELTERLGEVAADEPASERLRLGMLADDASDGSDNVGPFAGAVAEAPRRRSNRATEPAQRATADKQPVKRSGEAKQANKAPRADRDADADRRRADRELKDAERVHRLVTRDLGRADSAVRQASSVVDAATDAVAQANANLDRANQRLAREEAEREGVQRRMDQAERELERARRSLAELADR